MKVFPILYQGIERQPGWPVAIEWADVFFHEYQITINHGQTLGAIAKRGGLSPRELFAAMKGLELGDKSALPASDQAAMDAMKDWPRAWVYGRDKGGATDGQ